MRLRAPGLLRLISNFTGLHTDDRIIRKMQNQKQWGTRLWLGRQTTTGSTQEIPNALQEAHNPSDLAAYGRPDLRQMQNEKQ